jgi:hypothetical protein
MFIEHTIYYYSMLYACKVGIHPKLLLFCPNSPKLLDVEVFLCGMSGHVEKERSLIVITTLEYPRISSFVITWGYDAT